MSNNTLRQACYVIDFYRICMLNNMFCISSFPFSPLSCLFWYDSLINKWISIYVHNVRGLGNKTKRENVFAWLKDNKYSICLLQETHSGEGTHRDWVKEWGIDAFFSGTSDNSEGVGILINPKLSFNIKQHSEIIIGRLHALELNIEERDIIILNLYAPNTDSVNYFEILENI